MEFQHHNYVNPAFALGDGLARIKPTIKLQTYQPDFHIAYFLTASPDNWKGVCLWVVQTISKPAKTNISLQLSDQNRKSGEKCN